MVALGWAFRQSRPGPSVSSTIRHGGWGIRSRNSSRSLFDALSVRGTDVRPDYVVDWANCGHEYLPSTDSLRARVPPLTGWQSTHARHDSSTGATRRSRLSGEKASINGAQQNPRNPGPQISRRREWARRYPARSRHGGELNPDTTRAPRPLFAEKTRLSLRVDDVLRSWVARCHAVLMYVPRRRSVR